MHTLPWRDGQQALPGGGRVVLIGVCGISARSPLSVSEVHHQSEAPPGRMSPCWRDRGREQRPQRRSRSHQRASSERWPCPPPRWDRKPERPGHFSFGRFTLQRSEQLREQHRNSLRPLPDSPTAPPLPASASPTRRLPGPLGGLSEALRPSWGHLPARGLLPGTRASAQARHSDMSARTLHADTGLSTPPVPPARLPGDGDRTGSPRRPRLAAPAPELPTLTF